MSISKLKDINLGDLGIKKKTNIHGFALSDEPKMRLEKFNEKFSF